MRIGGLAVVVVALALAPAAAQAVTFKVTTTGDEPDANLADTPNACDVSPDAGDQCTLRAAIQEANDTPGADQVRFSIPGDGVHTIVPAIVLPVITGPTVVNGYTQPGASHNHNSFGKPDEARLMIELSGTNLTDPIDYGLRTGTGASGTHIDGLAVNRFPTQLILDTDGFVSLNGDFIGTNPAGTKALAGAGNGVLVHRGNSQIGGDDPEARNVISGNGENGIASSGTLSFTGNYVGTQSDGRSPLGNSGNGVDLFGPEVALVGVESSPNVIAFNGNAGVDVHDPQTLASIRANRLFGNDGLGIDLFDDGPSANDPGDGDTGPNTLQNFPILDAARTRHGATKVEGTLSTTPQKPFNLDFFSNRPNGSEGRSFLGSLQVTTTMDGVADFTFKPGKPLRPGGTVTATATNMNGGTSELSPPRRVKAA